MARQRLGPPQEPLGDSGAAPLDIGGAPIVDTTTLIVELPRPPVMKPDTSILKESLSATSVPAV